MSKAAGDNEYKILKSGPDFCWRGERVEDLPLMSESNGAVCQPLAEYFGESFRNKRVAVSTMYGEAVILREWWHFLDKAGRPWVDVSDQLLIEWREHLKETDEKKSKIQQREEIDAHNRRVRKIEVVLTFYRYASADRYRLARRSFMSRSGPITVRPVASAPSRGGRRNGRHSNREPDHLAWASAESRRLKVSQRPTPDAQAVASILAYLRSQSRSAPEEGKPRGRGRPNNPHLAERDWLIGCSKVEGGLRAEECTTLSIVSLAKGLTKAGIIIPGRESLDDLLPHCPSQLRDLDVLAYSTAGRTAVVAQIERLRRKHRKNIFVLVHGKGSKSREVPFPIDHVQDILEIAVWNIRSNQIKMARKQLSGLLPSDSIYLSAGSKPPRSVTPGYVGKIMKDAFIAAGVPGSGQRLRAWYATKTAGLLFEEAFALNGFRWDQTVENLVLDQLAQALGHATVTTTVRSYLDMQLLKHFGVQDKSKLALMRDTALEIFKLHASLTKKDFQRIVEVARRLASAPGGYAELIDAAHLDPDFRLGPPSAAADPPPDAPAWVAPSLRIVPS